MAGVRELLAVVLGVGLGVGLLVAPRTALGLSVVGGAPRRPRGEYGRDGDVPERWAWVVRAVGLACLVVAALVGLRAYA